MKKIYEEPVVMIAMIEDIITDDGNIIPGVNSGSDGVL